MFDYIYYIVAGGTIRSNILGPKSPLGTSFCSLSSNITKNSCFRFSLQKARLIHLSFDRLTSVLMAYSIFLGSMLCFWQEEALKKWTKKLQHLAKQLLGIWCFGSSKSKNDKNRTCYFHASRKNVLIWIRMNTLSQVYQNTCSAFL